MGVAEEVATTSDEAIVGYFERKKLERAVGKLAPGKVRGGMPASSGGGDKEIKRMITDESNVVDTAKVMEICNYVKV